LTFIIVLVFHSLKHIQLFYLYASQCHNCTN